MSLVIQKESTLVASTAVSKQEKDEPIVQLTNKSDKLKAVASVAASMNKQYDCKLIQKLGKGKAAIRIPSLSTNLPTFDEDVCGCGGIPRGRMIEIYGPESAGKTAFALHIIAQAQKAGGLAAIVDAEHALMLAHAKTIGVNIDELIISQPDYGEQALEVVDALAKTGAVDVIVVDSVSALVPKAELEGDMGDSHMGLQARLMSQAMRKLVGTAAKSGTIIIFINQVRMKIGVMFGNPETTTGGNALKFYASLRFEVRRLSKTDGGEIKDGDIHIGHRMRIKNIKNKVGNPYRETQVDLMYDSGFNTKLDTVEFLVDHDIVTSGNKGWVTFDGETYRKDQLTEGDIYEKIVLAAKRLIDDKVKTAGG
jgi:recombination protein RecA